MTENHCNCETVFPSIAPDSWEYCAKYDAQFCKTCDVWTEPDCTCGTDECQFKGRPDKPSELTNDCNSKPVF